MGMMDFSIGGSDNASDYAYTLGNLIAKDMKKHLKNEDNEYNTQGYEDVALVLSALFEEYAFRHNENLIAIAKKCIKMAKEDGKTFESASGKYNDPFTKEYAKVFKGLKLAVKEHKEWYE